MFIHVMPVFNVLFIEFVRVFFVMFLCEQSILLPYLHMKPDLLIDFSFFKLPASSCVWLIVFDCYLWFIFLSAIVIFSIITTLNCNILYCYTIVLLLLHVYKRYLKVGSRSRRMGLNGTCAKGETQLCFYPSPPLFRAKEIETAEIWAWKLNYLFCFCLWVLKACHPMFRSTSKLPLFQIHA